MSDVADLDVRLPMGVMFVLLGAVLAIYGIVSDQLSMDINVNLWWGLVILVFGALMLALAKRSKVTAPRLECDATSRDVP